MLVMSLVLGMIATPVRAESGDRQSMPALSAWITRYLTEQYQLGPAAVSALRLAPWDERLRLARCDEALRIVLSPEPRPGQARLQVHCDRSGGWRLNLRAEWPAESGQMILAARRSLPRGHVLGAADLVEIPAATPELAGSVGIDQAERVMGQILAAPLRAGQPLSERSLRARSLIEVGDQVMVSVNGEGFGIRAEFRALSAATAGARFLAENLKTGARRWLIAEGEAQARLP